MKDSRTLSGLRLIRSPGVDVSRQLDAKPKGGRPRGGIREAARVLGLGESEVRRALKIAAMPKLAKQAAHDAGLDNNQSALLRAAGADDPVLEMWRIIAERSAPKAKPSGADKFCPHCGGQLNARVKP